MPENGEFSSMLDRFGESEQSESTENSVEKIGQTDQNKIVNNFPNYVEHKEHLDKVLEKVNENLNKKNEELLSYEIFIEITNNVLVNLKKDNYAGDELNDIINSYFGDVFLLSSEKGLIDRPAFNQKVSDFFLKTIEDKINEQLTQTINQTAETVNQQKNTLDILDEKTINELNELTKNRDTIKNDNTLDQEIRDNFTILIGDFNKFVKDLYELDPNEVDPNKKALIDKLNTFDFTAQQKEEYLKNLYIYGRILANTKEDRDPIYQDFINKFQKLSNNMGIDAVVLSNIVENSISKPISVFKELTKSSVDEASKRRAMSFSGASESIHHNPSIGKFIEGKDQNTVSDEAQEQLKKHFEEFEGYISDGDKTKIDLNKIENANIPQAEKSKLKQKATELNQKAEDILDKDQKTESLIRERIIVNCFKYLSEYFANQGYDENMEIDITGGINFNPDTMQLKVKGKIKGKGNPEGDFVEIDYNLGTGEVAMHDFFAYDENEKRFKIGIGHNKRELLKGVKMPKYKELETEAKRIDYQKIINRTKSVNDYERDARSILNKNLGRKFTNQNINKFYIERFNEKNVAEQQMLQNIFNIWGIDTEIEQSGIGTEKPNQYKMLQLIHSSLEYYADPQVFRKLQANMQKLTDMVLGIKEGQSKVEDPVMLHLFTKDQNISSGQKWKGKSESDETKDIPKKETNYELNFFSFFNILAVEKNEQGLPIIDVSLFSEIMTGLKDKNKISENTFKKGGFDKKYNKIYSNIYLAEAMDKAWD